MRILVVDDKPDLRRALRRMISKLPETEVVEAGTVEAALSLAAQGDIDLMLVDIRLSDDLDDRGGLDLMQELRRRGANIPAMVVSSSSEIEHLREAMRLGARDYVLKDELSSELLLPLIEEFQHRLTLRREVQRLRDQVRQVQGPSALVGSSPAMERVRRAVLRLADANSPVLIRGETGTGKEMVARALHEASTRHDEPFVAQNCSAIPGELLESLLFGHERGAFTGADRKRRGRFEMAGAGTILLDEIGDMSLELQSKLLRVLETQMFLPVGAERDVQLRARVLAATNVDLEAAMQSGRFRRDLYYRLNVVTIHLPPLHERGDDVADIVQSFLETLPRRITFTPEAHAWLVRRRWPGNVRELRNAITRVSLMADCEVVDLRTVMELVDGGGLEEKSTGPVEALVDAVLALPDSVGPKLPLVERALFARALERSNGNKSNAAKLLGLHRKAVERRWERLSHPSSSPSSDDDE